MGKCRHRRCALLKVGKDKIDIQYIDQDGYVGYKQTWS
jgi:hypothetical protein